MSYLGLNSRLIKCLSLRNYAKQFAKCTRGISEKAVTESEKLSSMSAQELVKQYVKPSDYQKKLLVFGGLYKNAAEIPPTVSYEAMQKARNKVRIRVANYMMGATVIGCLFMVMLGKKAADAGETVSKMNMDWHREYNEQAKAEDLAKKNKM